MKSKLRFHLCFICMLALAVAGCKVKRPNDVIPESKMESLLYDYHLAKSMGDNLPYSENYKKALYLDAVFRKHGTTQGTYILTIADVNPVIVPVRPVFHMPCISWNQSRCS